MARRSEHSLEQIREMVLNAAKHIIQEEGIEALTVRKIALEIGYTVGSIYMVFANMQDLILHVKAKTLDELSADLPPQTADTCVEQQIFCLANYYLQFATQHFNLWRIIFTADLANVSNAPDGYRE